MAQVRFDNRITRMLGVDIPIVSAPMGGVATPQLVAAMANAGAVGLVPGSLGVATTAAHIREVRSLSNRPFGANIPISYSEAGTADILLEAGIRFVTTSTGPVPPWTARLQAAGITVFHVVTSLDAAKQAADSGVDGLIVEGNEGAGLRGDVSMMVLLPLVTSQIDLPVIAAGGVTDGASMAAAFMLGAEGVQMGTRMLVSAESAVHDKLKQAVTEAAETDTMMIDRHTKRPVRVLRTRSTEPYEFATDREAFAELVRGVPNVYTKGDLEQGFVAVGQVAGRIDKVLPVADIIREAVESFGAAIERMSRNHLVPAANGG